MADKVHPSAPAFPESTANSFSINLPEHDIRKEQERSFLKKRQDPSLYNPAPSQRPHRQRRSNPCCWCFSCLCGILSIFLVLLGIAALVLYLVLDPKRPRFSVTDAHISNFSTMAAPSSSDAAAFYLDADVTFTVLAENPNKKIGIYYDAVDMALLYADVEIGTGSIPPFYQGHRNSTQLLLKMTGADIPLTKSTGTMLQSSLASNSSIWLQADGTAHVRLKVGSWKSKDSKFRVNCDVEIINLSAGNVHLVSKHCKLKLKRLRLF